MLSLRVIRCCELFAACCLLSVVRCSLCGVWFVYLLCAICCQPFCRRFRSLLFVCCLLFAFRFLMCVLLLRVACCLLLHVRWLVHAVRRLMFVVCCLMRAAYVRYVFCCLLIVAKCLLCVLFVGRCLLFAMCCFAVCCARPLLFICCLLFFFCRCLSFVICCLLFAVRCL